MNTLVLNRSFFAIQIANWQRAITLVYGGHAKVIDSDYNGYNFDEWVEVSKTKVLTGSHQIVHSQKLTIVIPDVISLLFYDKLPPQDVILTRETIFARDHFKCGYCGKQHKRQDLTWDHIIPRSQGGRNTWKNLITSCYSCNQKKSGLTPKEARMKLLFEPTKPKWRGKLGISLGSIKMKKSWQSFLDHVYWNAPLDEK